MKFIIKIYLAVVFVPTLVQTQTFAQTTTENLVQSMGGQWADHGNAITTDSKGNMYITGSFQGKSTFGGKEIHSKGDTDMFISKIDEKGNVIWVKTGGSTLWKKNMITEYGTDIAVYEDKYVYAIGIFSSTAQFDDKTVTSNGKDDIFIAKYTTEGSLVWIKSAGGPSQDIPTSLALDGKGNLYITGTFQKEAIFDTQSLTATNSTDVFIAKYSPNGNLIWVKQSNSNSKGSASVIKCTNDFCIIGGQFKNEMKFGARIADAEKQGAFLTKIDLNGNTIWLKTIDGSGLSDIVDLSINNGNIYIAGTFEGVLQDSLASLGKKDVMIGCYSNFGEQKWLKGIGGGENDKAKKIIAGSNSTLYVSGLYGGKMIVGDTVIENSFGRNVFIMSLDAAGGFNWFEGLGGPAQSEINDIHLNLGNLYSTGFFWGSSVAYGSSLGSSGGSDVFITRAANIYSLEEENTIKNLYELDLYPNPASESFRINSKDLIESFTIIDALGKHIYSKNKVNKNTYEVKVDRFRSGVYTVKIETIAGAFEKRLVVE